MSSGLIVMNPNSSSFRARKSTFGFFGLGQGRGAGRRAGSLARAPDLQFQALLVSVCVCGVFGWVLPSSVEKRGLRRGLSLWVKERGISREPSAFSSQRHFPPVPAQTRIGSLCSRWFSLVLLGQTHTGRGERSAVLLIGRGRSLPRLSSLRLIQVQGKRKLTPPQGPVCKGNPSGL